MTGLRDRPDMVLWYLSWLILIILQGLTIR